MWKEGLDDGAGGDDSGGEEYLQLNGAPGLETGKGDQSMQVGEKQNKRDEPFERFQSQGQVQGHENEHDRIHKYAIDKSTVMPTLNVIA